jgi:hypothetical protein
MPLGHMAYAIRDAAVRSTIMAGHVVLGDGRPWPAPRAPGGGAPRWGRDRNRAVPAARPGGVVRVRWAVPDAGRRREPAPVTVGPGRRSAPGRPVPGAGCARSGPRYRVPTVTVAGRSRAERPPDARGDGGRGR